MTTQGFWALLAVVGALWGCSDSNASARDPVSPADASSSPERATPPDGPLNGDVLVDGSPDAASPSSGLLAVGSGEGGNPEVALFDDAFLSQGSFMAYAVGHSGGVRVAAGDVNQDGVNDIAVAPGPGAAAHVAIFDGRTHAPIGAFDAFSASFTGGAYVALGDVDGDTIDDVVVGAGGSSGPLVNVFSGKTFALIKSFFAFAPAFAGGVTVAVGDVDADGFGDIVCGSATAASNVTVYSGATGKLLRSFSAFAAGGTTGVYVASGDLDGDDHAEVVVGSAAGATPLVSVYGGVDGKLVRSFLAFPAAFMGGVRVGVSRSNVGMKILAGAGPGGSPEVKLFTSDGGPGGAFLAYPAGFTGGVYVAGAP